LLTERSADGPLGLGEELLSLGKVGGRRSEVGGRRSEVGGRRSEVGSQRSEVGGRRSEVGDGGQRPEVGGRDRRLLLDMRLSGCWARLLLGPSVVGCFHQLRGEMCSVPPSCSSGNQIPNQMRNRRRLRVKTHRVKTQTWQFFYACVGFPTFARHRGNLPRAWRGRRAGADYRSCQNQPYRIHTIGGGAFGGSGSGLGLAGTGGSGPFCQRRLKGLAPTASTTSRPPLMSYRRSDLL
jgi:hypothetical protein